MAAMKIHISASAKEALDAVGGYYTELRGTWTVNIDSQFDVLYYCRNSNSKGMLNITKGILYPTIIINI